MNRIYLIERTDEVNYDEYDATVIIAKTPEEAKNLALKLEGFTTEDKIICELIGIANKDQPIGEVLCSFNAG